MILRKDGRLPADIFLIYNNSEIEVINKFNYLILGVVFTSDGSFSEAHKTLTGQSLEAIFQINKCLYTFTIYISVQHILDFTPFMKCAGEMWVFIGGNNIENMANPDV